MVAAGEIRRVVVVGAGQAGLNVARALRGERFGGEIVLIGEEPHPPYERPPLSKAVLAGAAAPDSVLLIKPEAFARLELDFRPGTRALAIDRDARSLALASGERLRYDRLVLATGGAARKPAIPGIDFTGVFGLRSLEDSLAIRAELSDGKRLAVLGGGWIGLEVAATARRRGLEVTVFEVADRLCARVAPPLLSRYLEALHRANGVALRLGESIGEIVAEGDGLALTLTSGEVLAVDCLVYGIGLVANDQLARAAGLECDGGILTDAEGRTADSATFACGDVAVFAHPALDGRRRRLESWGNAQHQPVATAKALLGLEVRYEEIPWFWSDQYKTNIQMLGLPDPARESVLRGRIEEGRFSLFWLADGTISAAVAVNAASDIQVAKRLMQRRKTVETAALADPAQNLRALLK
ncbi:MAG: NAD(P)/FAD-dependent oxidoreductase [Kiloniellales bacterium]